MLRSLLMLGIYFLACTNAMVPPKLGTAIERGHLYRERAGIVHNYTPRLVHPEMCRLVTVAECQKHDQRLQVHAQKHRKIQAKLYQERQQRRDKEEVQQDLGAFTRAYRRGPEHQPTIEEELAELEHLLIEFNTTVREEHNRRRRHLQSDRQGSRHNPSAGTFVVPVLLVRFTDHKSRELPPMYVYQILWNLRIKKWLQENSYGRYDAFFDVQDWTMSDNTEIHYADGNSGRTGCCQQSFWPALDEMDERLGGDWSLYDADGDGALDNVVVLHSGYAAEEAGVDCTNGRDSSDRIWSFAFAAGGGWVSSNGQYTLRGYMISTALDLVCDSNPAKMGVMTHEYEHTFGLIDLYDYSFKGKGVGHYDIMAYPYGLDSTGYMPVMFSVWSKQEVEWLTCAEITEPGVYYIEPAEVAESCYRISLLGPGSWEEYILLENRQQKDFDINFHSSGLLMYHIDDAADGQMYTGYPGLEGWPENGDHYRIAVIQADGNYDLEKGVNLGDSGDFWGPGMKLTPNYDDNTFPNTDSYQLGYIQRTGITIEVFDNDGLNVCIKVSFDEAMALSAPTKEREQGGSNASTHFADDKNAGIPCIAEAQFEAPDSDQRISGKLPDLPWYKEWRESQQQKQNDEDAQRLSRGSSIFGWFQILMALATAVSLIFV